MNGLKPETIRRMKLAWGLSLGMFAFPCFKACFTTPSAVPGSIAFLILAPALFACFPLIGELTERKQAQRTAESARWRQEYKASPESRLIRLNDSE